MQLQMLALGAGVVQCREDGEKPEKAWEHADKYQRAFTRGILNGAVDFATGIIEIPKLAVDAGYGLADTEKAAGKWLENYRGNPADLMGELADRAVELQKAAFRMAEDLGTVTKEKLSGMKTEDWFEAGGYATSVIASFFLGGAGAAGEAADTANAAGKTAEATVAGKIADSSDETLNAAEKVDAALKGVVKDKAVAGTVDKAGDAAKHAETTGKVISGVGDGNAIKGAKTVSLSSEQAEEYAFDAIHGSNKADSVVLGKFDGGGSTSYTEVAKNMDAQYFQLDNWDDLASVYSEDEIWKINEKFLDIQTSSGREIYLSHNPEDYIGKGQFYSKELQYLLDNGYHFVDEGGIWHAIR